jgi:hypothetical protein
MYAIHGAVGVISLVKKLFSNQSAIGVSAILIAIFVCGAPLVDIPFHIVATYRANLSGYQIDIDSEGTIPAGHDITTTGTAHAIITSLSPNKKPDLTIDIDAEGSATSLVDGQAGISFNWFQTPQEEMLRLLEGAGYRNTSMDEIGETVRIINGAMAGSKAVIMEGQTKWLEVVDVQIRH